MQDIELIDSVIKACSDESVQEQIESICKAASDVMMEFYGYSLFTSNQFRVIATFEGKNEIVLLKKYLQINFQLYRRIWMKEDYENYWEAKDLTKNNFRKADAELTLIIRTIGSKP